MLASVSCSSFAHVHRANIKVFLLFSSFLQVQAAIAALRAVGELSIPPELMWNPDMDLLDWLGALFGFQVRVLPIDDLNLQQKNLLDVSPVPLVSDGRWFCCLAER
jgi:hypothetical protein